MTTYVAIIEGQSVDVPAEIAMDDAAVAEALSPYFPEAAEAEFSRTTKGEVVTITVTPRGKTKGGSPLAAGPERL